MEREGKRSAVCLPASPAGVSAGYQGTPDGLESCDTAMSEGKEDWRGDLSDALEGGAERDGPPQYWGTESGGEVGRGGKR